MGVVFLIVIIVIAVWVLASCVRIVPQAYAVILERLGAYQATWSTGIHFKVPFIERVARKSQIRSFILTVWRIRSWQSRICPQQH